MVPPWSTALESREAIATQYGVPNIICCMLGLYKHPETGGVVAREIKSRDNRVVYNNVVSRPANIYRICMAYRPVLWFITCCSQALGLYFILPMKVFGEKRCLPK